MVISDFNPSEMKVLLVDDTTANLEVLSKTLEPEGYQIATAKSGEKALKLAPLLKPDLILLDIMMPPGMDGFETCRLLKENKKTKDIPIIFITAKTETEDIVKGFQLGSVDYITKPFKQEEVCVRVKTHLQLQSSIKSLVALNGEKNKFLGIVAHDLRNPLSGILGFSDILRDDIDDMAPEKKVKCLDIIEVAAQGMLTMVNDLLDYSAIEAGRLDLDLELQSVNTLLDQRISIASLAATQKRITIRTEYNGIRTTRFDANRISQVIDNLLLNAIKFSPFDSEIVVCLNGGETSIEVSVRDQGPGIELSEQEKLFGDFSKLSNKPTAGEKSTGLGLAIAKKVVLAHGGNIQVRSETDKGATFVFSLPVLP
ncbi:MAG: hybrid sensor histidine kinase/response regulator [Proteobacteria bacterium]|nr:hybrid sensor histidine kinase/response regulator [Pseudomonadota bacterium]